MKCSLIKLGITGGIGSGKSFFSNLLRAKGVPVFDSDSEAKKLMVSDESIIFALKALLGEEVYVDGKINKPMLASYIFSSSDNAEKINSRVHPCVKKAFLAWADECFRSGHSIVAIESAILFESGFNDIVDKVVMVHAPFEVRVSRVMERDNTSKEKVMERIKSQMDDERKLSLSDFVIETDGVRSLEEQTDMLFSGFGRIKDN